MGSPGLRRAAQAGSVGGITAAGVTSGVFAMWDLHIGQTLVPILLTNPLVGFATATRVYRLVSARRLEQRVAALKRLRRGLPVASRPVDRLFRRAGVTIDLGAGNADAHGVVALAAVAIVRKLLLVLVDLAFVRAGLFCGLAVDLRAADAHRPLWVALALVAVVHKLLLIGVGLAFVKASRRTIAVITTVDTAGQREANGK
jgi:phosphate/sulfate permease